MCALARPSERAHKATVATTPFARRERGFCTRCHAHTTFEHPWAGWRWVRRGWFVGMGLIVLGSPVIGADAFVLIPMSLVFATALGPLADLVARKATCLTCGAPLEHRLVAAET